jgi:polysaccharide export outer membrane protein
VAIGASASVSSNPVAMAPSHVRSTLSLVLLLVTLAPLPVLGQANGASAPLELRPGDAVRVEIRDEPDLAGDFQIDESGRVLLPLIGLVSVAGRDFTRVRGEVEGAYVRELSHSEVRVTPLLRVAVIGEVRLPGLYPVDPTYALGDVLALAGGLGPDAAQDGIELVREGRTIAEVRVDDPSALGLALRSGDQVVVARRSWVSANTSALVGAGASLVVAIVTTLLLR